MRQAPDWTSAFPGLQRLPPDVLTPLLRDSAIVTLPAGSRIFGPGQAPNSFLLLLDGTVRVQQVSEQGREIVLYRVSAGESCALTTACLMGYEDYLAEAIAETGVRAVAIPRMTFDDLIARSPDFRRFVFTAFSRRVTDLFRVIEDVAFSRMDIRIAHKILELAGDQDQIAITQQQIAAELGSAREVVNRVLTEFRRRGWVEPHRGHILLRNKPALAQLAEGH
ncbi:MAG: Crp/Fnr family transcriptional regulator [Acetobacteraceae bacterium]